MSRAKIAVLGAGPSGLSAAYAAASVGAEVDVYDANGRAGGSVWSERVGSNDASSFAYDLGAGSMRLKHARVQKLITDELGLSGSILERTKKARSVYIVRDGELVPLPSNPVALLGSKLLSFRGKASIFLEPFARRLKDEQSARKETVGGFFARRFSPEVVQYVVDPAVAGIYSGDVAKLSMRYTFGDVWDAERNQGSVLLSLITKKRAPESKALRRSISFEGGMQTLTNALVKQTEANGGRILPGSAVRSLSRGRDGHWRVNYRKKYDAVICALPAHALADVSSNVPLIESAFQRIARKVPYASVAVAALGFRRDQVAHALDAFGVLVPSTERRKVMGIQFASEGYPKKSRADGEKEMVFLTVYLGGTRNPEVIRTEDAALAAAKEEVSDLLGVKGEPCFSKIHVWKNGIPQYHGGHGGMMTTVRRLELRAPGLVFAGNYRNGVGVPDAIMSGLKAAEKALHYFEKLKSLNDPSRPAWPVGS